MPLWEEAPAVPTQTLNLNAGFTATAAAQSGDFTYTSSGSSVTITGYTGAGGAVEIPAQIGGIPVTAIGANAFFNKVTVVTVSIPSGVKSIGSWAISNCWNLTDITVDAANTAYTSVDGILYSKTLTTLIQCPSGKPGIVSISSAVKSIEASAFYYCQNLVGIAVDVANTAYTSIDGVLYDKSLTTLIECPGGKTGSVAIPMGVQTISGDAFVGCKGITGVTMPNSVTSMGSFNEATSLTSITVSGGVTQIIENGFANCTGLTTVTLLGAVRTIGLYAFFNCRALKSLTVWGNFAPTADVTAFYSGATPGVIPVTVYRPPNSVGWSSTLAGCPVVTLQSAFTYSQANYALTITGYAANLELPPNLDIPSQLFGIPVTTIGSWAFVNKGLASVKIPASVTAIGQGAFQSCTGLTAVTLYGTVGSIGATAFSSCPALKTLNVWGNAPSTDATAFGSSPVTIYRPATTTGWSSTLAGRPVVLFQSDFNYTQANYELKITGYTGTSTALTTPAELFGMRVTAIGDNAFASNTNLTSITISSGVTGIGASAFSECTTLAGVMLPAGLLTLGDYVFRGCKSLTGFSIPSTVASIGTMVFDGCTALAAINVVASSSAYASIDGVLYNKSLTTLVQWPAGKVGGVVISTGVTTIGAGAFGGCTKLVDVTLPAGLLVIGDFVFRGCNSLGRISIPSTVTSVGLMVFSGCAALTAIDVVATSSAYASIDGVLYDKSLTTLMQCPGGKTGSVAIPMGVQTISGDAFVGCKGITGVTMPNSVTSMGSFNGATSLTSITVSGGVTQIIENGFANCTGLTTVTLLGAVRTIGLYAFSNCPALTTLNVWGEAPSTTATAFSNSPVTVYRRPAAAGWSSTLAGRPVVLFQGVFNYTQANYELAITGYTGSSAILETPTQLFGMPVTAIGVSAFANKTGLTSVTISAGVLSIGASAFSGCTKLVSVSLPAGLLTIQDVAFIRCSSLVGVSIPATVTSIGGGVFFQCAGLVAINVPASVTSIGARAFEACTRLTTVTLYGTVGSIGATAFSSCPALKTLNVWGNAPSTDATAFGSSPVTIYRSATTTGWSSTLAGRPVVLFQSDFNYTQANYELKITGYTGSSAILEAPTQLFGMPVTAIGVSAFANKTGLTSVTISPGVLSIGASAFSGCIKLSGVTLPTGLLTLGDSAFYGCSSLAAITIPPSVGSVGSSTFLSCTGLTSITIPAGLTSIGSSAFSQCSAMRSMYFFASPPSLGSSAFSRSPLTVYRLSSATGWSSTYDGRPVEIFRPVDVAAGQTTTPTIDAAISRVLKQGTGTAILSTASTRTGGTVVEAGELVVRQKDALGTGLLEVQAGARATFQTGYDTVSVTSLNLASTSRLELGTGKLTVAANGFTESDIRTKLIAGRNGGSWDGASGITSTFAGSDRTIGYRVADGALEVAYAAPGDSNLDGVIDIMDIADIISAGKFNTGATANWRQGDVNYDNVFDIVDLADILGTNLFNQGNYLTQGSVSSAAVDMGTVATFDSALVFAALAAEPTSQPTTKRKSF